MGVVTGYMMDHNMISAIIKVIKQSNMLDLDFITVEERPVTIDVDESGNETHSVMINFCVNMCSYKAHLSEAWVAGSIMFFLVFDGYLENKYNLDEGVSFRDHYKALPENTQLEIIEKDCYRIMKIIRNAIQHNLSNVSYNQGALSISYTYRNVNYNLEISSWSMKYLYTIVLSLIQDNVADISKKYRTDGHYAGMLNSMYNEVRKGIKKISDDIPDDFIGVVDKFDNYDPDHLRVSVRYPVENPLIISDDEVSVVFKHIENNTTDNENDREYQYSTDYVYGKYLLPQELGVIRREDGINTKKNRSDATIRFYKSDITNLWEMKI